VNTRVAGRPRRVVLGAGDEMGWPSFGRAGRVGRKSADGDDGGAQAGVGREDTVVTVAVHARRGHEGDEALEELEGREDDLGAPVERGFGKAVQNTCLGGGEGGNAGEGVEAFEREGGPGTVAEEALEAGTVIALDAHRSVDAEAAGTLPGEHVESVELVEQPVGTEVSEDATLNDALEPGPVLGLEKRRFVEASLSVVAVVAWGEDAVEDDQMEVEMGIEGGAEAVQEADGSELRVGGRAGTDATQAGADPPQEDLEDGACDVRVVMQEGPEALWDREDPLPGGEVG